MNECIETDGTLRIDYGGVTRVFDFGMLDNGFQVQFSNLQFLSQHYITAPTTCHQPYLDSQKSNHPTMPVRLCSLTQPLKTKLAIVALNTASTRYSRW